MAADGATTHPMRRLLSGRFAHHPGPLAGRRGLLAGTAALVGAGLAKLSGPDRAEATHGIAPPGAAAGLDTLALHIGQLNTATSDTYLGRSNTTPNRIALEVVNGNGRGLLAYGGTGGAVTYGASNGTSAGAGIIGISRVNTGVRGESSQSTGVYGISQASDTELTGVPSIRSGVAGTSDTGCGVLGQSGTNAGVYGRSVTNAGVFGDSATVAVAGVTTNGLGVQGTSTTNAGVYGQSTYNAAVFGTSPYAGVQGSSTGIAVWGQTNGGTAVFGQNLSGIGWAGQFAGNVYITGSLTVASGAKSAAVKKKDGSMARVYCQESPEPWFEDFGTAELKGGQASVALDPEFDEVVDGNDYRVFLTPVGVGCGSLYVSRKGPHRFEVMSFGGAMAAGSFDYRVVARRADRVGGRLEKVEIPARSAAAAQATQPSQPPVPPVPPLPKAVDRKDLPQPVEIKRADPSDRLPPRGNG